MTRPSVAVIGGGFTGLTAAYRLAQAGCEVTVYEAGTDLGGLAGGFEIDGRPLEKAYHFLYRTDEHILALVDELGLADSITFHASSVSTYYDGHLYPMMTPLDLLRFRPLRFRNRVRAGATVLYLQRVRNWQRLTRVTALEWLRRWAGREVTEVLWEPLLRGKFDHYYDKVTMAWLWGRVKQRVESREGTSEVLGYVNGGFVSIIDALVDRIVDHGGTIKLSTPVDRVTHDPTSDTVGVHTPSGYEDYDQVLTTVPSGVAAQLLRDYHPADPDYFAQLSAVEYLSAVVFVFTSDQQLSPYYWHNINAFGSAFVVLLDLTNLIGSDSFGGKHVYYIGDYVPQDHWSCQADEADVKSRWFDQLKELFPDFDRSMVSEEHLFRLRNAQHIVDTRFHEKLVDHQTPCPGVLLANFSQIFPMDRGTNYAVRDGIEMAETILAREADHRQAQLGPTRHPHTPVKSEVPQEFCQRSNVAGGGARTGTVPKLGEGPVRELPLSAVRAPDRAGLA